jgi:hypothetical protein
MVRFRWGLLPVLALMVAACRAPAPGSNAAQPARPTAAATATPNPAATALSLVPLRIDESPLPPPEPTPAGYPAGRPTPTPAVTPDPATRYLTIAVAIENRSAEPRLVGIAGRDPTTTNLANAVLTAGDGKRYKPVATSTSLGMRTATSHALITYPVLLRLPPGFRATGESAGSLSVVAPTATTLTFMVPAGLTSYGTLSVPAIPNLASRAGEDEVTRGLRPLIGGFAPLDLSGVKVGSSHLAFPFDQVPPGTPTVGDSVSNSANSVSISLLAAEAAEPEDFALRSGGWKQLTLSLRYHNDDTQHDRAFSVSAWLFGDDGVAYTGDAPTLGDFGRSLSAPDPAAIMLWDGRSAGADLTPAGQALEPRRATFYVPRALRSAVLVLAGDAEATFALTNLPSP